MFSGENENGLSKKYFLNICFKLNSIKMFIKMLWTEAKGRVATENKGIFVRSKLR